MRNQTPNISSIVNAPETNRLPWLDFASGIMILWMIAYHVIQVVWGYEVNPCVVFPWLHFFMPWFFYKSGMFFQKRSVKELWMKDRQKLLKTFLIWAIVGYVLFLFIGICNHTLTLRNTTYLVIRRLFMAGAPPLNTPLWFLLTLFGVRFVANIALPDRGDEFGVLKLVGVVLLGYIVSYLAYRFNHRLLPYWVANGAAGLSFFALGYAVRDWEPKWWLCLLCIVVYVTGCIHGFPMVDMLPNKLLNGHYLLWVPIAFCCIVFFNTICCRLYKLIRIRPLEWVGKNAMLIYLSHMLIIQIIMAVITYF